MRVVINRKVSIGSVPFKEVFRGFEKVAAVKSIFGSRTDRVLSELRVDIEDGRGYMRINDKEGSVVVNAKYLKDGDETHLYLDVVHELVHIRQHMGGKELWDRRYAYVDRPTEIEAYRVVLEEARRLGLGEQEIVDYLRVDWVTDEEFGRFLRTLGVDG
ncbi:MAG: hypothetical protein ACLQEQ_02935 [Nitrososphaerales archaeon]